MIHPDKLTPELLEAARKAIEDELLELRDMRIGVLRNNGLVIKERDGSLSSIIRMGPEEAVIIGYRAIYEALKVKKPSRVQKRTGKK
jgi:hypothetical protein